MIKTPLTTNNPLQPLVGQTLWSVWAEGIDFVYFVLEDTVYKAEVEGECCSRSYFTKITGVKEAEGAKILSVCDVSGVDCPPTVPAYQEEDEDYIYGLEMSNGSTVVIYFRNSSNGYYGGWMNTVKSVQTLAGDIITENDFLFS